MIKIAVVQECAHENLSNNLEITQKYASEAAQRGCSVICFPECYLTGYRLDKAVCNAISLNAPALQQVSKIATENAIDILIGFMEKSDDSFYITHGLFRKDGTWDYYRKTHLGQREKEFFSPGDELKVLPLTDGTKIGIALCVETHYPDITQTLALRGAEVVFAPHAVPRISGTEKKSGANISRPEAMTTAFTWLAVIYGIIRASAADVWSPVPEEKLQQPALKIIRHFWSVR